MMVSLGGGGQDVNLIGGFEGGEGGFDGCGLRRESGRSDRTLVGGGLPR